MFILSKGFSQRPLNPLHDLVWLGLEHLAFLAAPKSDEGGSLQPC